MSLPQLFDAVKARLEAAGVTAEVVFGERQPPQQLNQGTGRANRVVFAPGDDAGNLGTYDAPVKPGRAARSLWDWMLLARVYVWAYDPSAPEDEIVQWKAVVELHDLVIEAIHAFCSAFYAPTSPKNVAKPNERRFGKEMVFLLVYRQPVLATPRERSAVAGTGQLIVATPSGDEPADG